VSLNTLTAVLQSFVLALILIIAAALRFHHLAPAGLDVLVLLTSTPWQWPLRLLRGAQSDASGVHPMRVRPHTGRQLAAARVLAGITQKQLAERAGLHVNRIRYMELIKFSDLDGECRSSMALTVFQWTPARLPSSRTVEFTSPLAALICAPLICVLVTRRIGLCSVSPTRNQST
jgi:hypothetical protein